MAGGSSTKTRAGSGASIRSRRISEEIVVTAPGDDHFNMIGFVNPVKFIQGWDVSPHGKRIIVDARGKLFSVPVKHGDTRKLTRGLKAREQIPAWSPDGRWIAYISDASGEQEIYLTDQMGQGEPRQLTQNGKFKLGLVGLPTARNSCFIRMITLSTCWMLRRKIL